MFTRIFGYFFGPGHRRDDTTHGWPEQDYYTQEDEGEQDEVDNEQEEDNGRCEREDEHLGGGVATQVPQYLQEHVHPVCVLEKPLQQRRRQTGAAGAAKAKKAKDLAGPNKKVGGKAKAPPQNNAQTTPMSAPARAFVRAFLADKYPEAKFFNSGGFSDLYLLPKSNKLLRITREPRRTPAYFRKMVAANAAIISRANRSGVTPHIDLVLARKSDASQNEEEELFVTTMDLVDNVVPFTEYAAQVFKSDARRLCTALFKAAHRIEKVGLIHQDISHNNILVQSCGSVVFIDLDSMCVVDTEVPDEKIFCNESLVNGTPGFEFYSSKMKERSPEYAHANSVLGRYQKMHFGLFALAALALRGRPIECRRSVQDNIDEMERQFAASPAVLAAARRTFGPVTGRFNSVDEILAALSSTSAKPASCIGVAAAAAAGKKKAAPTRRRKTRCGSGGGDGGRKKVKVTANKRRKPTS